MSAEIIIIPALMPVLLAAWAGKTAAQIADEIRNEKDRRVLATQRAALLRLQQMLDTAESQKGVLAEKALARGRDCQARMKALKTLFEGEGYSGRLAALEQGLVKAMQEAETLRDLPRHSTVSDIKQVNSRLAALAEKAERTSASLEKLKAQCTEKVAGRISGGIVDLGEEDPAAPEEAQDTAEYDRVWSLLEKLSLAELPEELEERVAAARKAADGVTDRSFLRDLCSLTLKPLEKEADEYARIREEYADLTVENAWLSDMTGAERRLYPCTEKGMEDLKVANEALRAALVRQQEKEYIARSVDEVFEEMGYTRIGSRETVGQTGARFSGRLYQLEGGTAVDVTYNSEGAITMELGGLDTRDREPAPEEQRQLTEDMESFCGDYETIARKLAEKGIDVSSFSSLPPQPAYATIINLEDYEHTENAVLVRKQQTKRVRAKKKSRTAD